MSLKNIFQIVMPRLSKEALARAAQEWQRTFDASSDAIWVLDEHQCVRRSNKAADRLFPCPGGAIGRHCWEIVHGSTAAIPECPVERARKSLQRETMELAIGGRWYQVTGDPILDDQGQYVGAIHLVSDITQRRQAEESLRESEARHRAVLRTALDGVWRVDTQGRLIEVNEAYCRMSGYSAQELLALRISDLTVAETPDETAAHIQQIMARGEDRFESRHRRKDGSVFDIEVSVQYQSAGGQMVAFLHDITKRKQAEARLQEMLASSTRDRLALLGMIEDETRAKTELRRLATAIEQAAEVIVITDPRGLIQYVNPAFEAVTGFTREEALGQNTSMLKSGEHDEAFYRELWKTISGGKTWSGRFINRKKNGDLYTEEATLSPVHDATGKIINYVCVKRDVTAELNLQTQLSQAQKMESVGRLAGGVAHDFNNLLMGIWGYADLARDALPKDHPVRVYLDEITKGAQRSADLTRQLLAFARKQTIMPKVLDLNAAMEGILKMLGQLIGEDVSLTWHPGSDLWPVKMDASQIDQILVNLCINARDAIAGVGTITLETANVTLDQAYAVNHADAVPGDYVRLTICDNGCGMDRETLAHIFEPFYTTKSVGKGTGLGLATVFGIVKQNHGCIDVCSEPGHGTTFKIYLPRHKGAAANPSAGVASVIPRGRGETVLLVEDEKSLRVTCGQFLQTLGYKTLVAETPAVAIRLVEAHTDDIHLLLTDVVMPGTNGLQLVPQIKEIKPGIKVLFMSGYTADVIAENGVIGEGLHFIEKPFSRSDLACKVREVLDGRDQVVT